MKKLLLSVAVLSAAGAYAQNEPAVKTEKAVGIETTEPRATLDVNGDARLQKVELMTASTPTTEIFPDCPCVLTIDKFGVIHRIPKDQFVLASGSTSGSPGSGAQTNPGGGQGGGPITPTPTPGTGNNQSTGGANLGNTVNATIEDQDNYVVSFIYNDQKLQGKIDNDAHKVSIKIPYTNGNGQSYSSAESKTTTTTESSEDGTSSPITMTIKEGTLTSGKGNIEAEIATPQLYNVKKLAPGVEKKIAEFKYTVNNQTKTVVLKAIGGIPDKNFADPDHKFVYFPITVTGTYKVNGKAYSKVWLNQNLGADYANIKGEHFSPKKIGGNKKLDFRAYGSLFQFGRDGDGHELMAWTSSNSGTWTKTDAEWWDSSDLGYNPGSDPCPHGYHTPKQSEWKDFQEAVVGSRGHYVQTDKFWTETSLNLATAQDRINFGTQIRTSDPDYGSYWSSTDKGGRDAAIMEISGDRYVAYKETGFKEVGYPIRCIKNGQ